MAVTLQYFLILVFVLIPATCTVIKIMRFDVPITGSNKNMKSFNYQITNGDYNPSDKSQTNYGEIGSRCLKPKEIFNVNIDILKDKKLGKFNFAFNSVDYKKYDRVEEEAEDMDGEDFCVLWGSWIPRKESKKLDIEIYFNVITKQTEILNRYLFLIDVTSLKGELDVDLRLDSLDRRIANEKKLITITRQLIESKCMYIEDKRSNYVLRNRKFTLQEDGKLKMIFLVDRSEEKEINLFIADSDVKKRLSSTSSLIWKKIQCSDEEFDFLLDNSNVSDSGFVAKVSDII